MESATSEGGGGRNLFRLLLLSRNFVGLRVRDRGEEGPLNDSSFCSSTRNRSFPCFVEDTGIGNCKFFFWFAGAYRISRAFRRSNSGRYL